MTLLDDAPAATATAVEPLAPGVYDMPPEEYHARPELSSSGMRKLLHPGTPALFRWEQLGHAEEKDEFDFGNVAHKLVLGEGEQVQILEFDSFRTNDSKVAKLKAYAEGKIPILEKDYAKAKAMAVEVRKHPEARLLLADGKPEQSLFWRDGATDEPLRARIDWLRRRRSTRLVLADYKTTTKVDPRSLSKAIYEHGYHQQAALYREAAMALDLGGRDTVSTLIFQSKNAPFLVHVVQLPEYELQLGSARNRAAIRIYRECMASGEWPAYPGVSRLEIPTWARTQDELEYLL